MTTDTTHLPATGRVHIQPANRYLAPAAFHGNLSIVKLPTGRREVNAVVENLDGRRLRVPPRFLVAGPIPDTSTATVVPYEPALLPGTLVRFNGDLWVVAADKIGPDGVNRYRLNLLGGSDRYVRGVPASNLTVIPLNRVQVSE
jgi:hypothetical protein